MKTIRVGVRCGNRVWWENYDETSWKWDEAIATQEDAERWAKKILAKFNQREEFRYGTQAVLRTIVAVEFKKMEDGR